MRLKFLYVYVRHAGFQMDVATHHVLVKGGTRCDTHVLLSCPWF